MVEGGYYFLAEGAVESVFGRGGERYDEDVVAAGEGEFGEGGGRWWSGGHVGQRGIVEIEGAEEGLAVKVMEVRKEVLIYLCN